MPSRLIIVMAALLLAGCGAGPAATPAGSASTAAVLAAGGSRAQALAFAWRLVNELRPPLGTRPVHLRKLPPPLTDPGPVRPGWVRVEQTLAAPVNPRSAWAGLVAHTPLAELGQVAPAEVGMGTNLPAPEPGLDYAAFSVTLVPLSRMTMLIAAEAEVAWLPVRTRAEHLDPAGFRMVTISAQRVFGNPRRASGTLTSAAVIARLAAFLNARTPAPGAAVIGWKCVPAPWDISVRFTAWHRDGPGVVATSGGCPGLDVITVNGRRQPLLWDIKGGLAAIALALLHETAA